MVRMCRRLVVIVLCLSLMLPALVISHPLEAKAADFPTLSTDNQWVTWTKAKNSTGKYTITVPQTGILTVQLQNVSDVSEMYPNYFQLRLKDEDLTTTYKTSDSFRYANAENPTTLTLKTSLEKGTYVVDFYTGSVSGRADSDMLRIRASFKAVSTNDGNTNHSFDQAKTISANTKITGMLTVNSGSDFYRFYVPAKDTIEISTYAPDRFHMSVYNKDREEIWSHASYNPRQGNQTLTLDLDKGYHYVRIGKYYADLELDCYTLIWKGSFTGFRTENGKKVYYKDGGRSTTTGLVLDPEDSKYKYVKEGVFQSSFTGLYQHTVNKKYYYLKNGVWQSGYTGLYQHSVNKKYYYLKGGIWQKGYDGLYVHSKNGWTYYLRNGIWNRVTEWYKHTSNGLTYYIETGLWRGIYKDKNGVQKISKNVKVP